MVEQRGTLIALNGLQRSHEPESVGSDHRLSTRASRRSRQPIAETIPPQVCPPSLELGERLRKAQLRLYGFMRVEAQLLLALSDKLTKLFRDGFSELIDSGFRMPRRTWHFKRHFVPRFCTKVAILNHCFC